MPTRLMLPAPSICPPERKKASPSPLSLPGLTRQSIVFRKKMDARGLSAFTRVFNALLPAHDGLRAASGGALGMHVAIEIGGKPVGARGHARILGEMRRIGGVVIGKRERPGAVRHDGDRLHIKAAERAGGERGIVEQVSLVELLHSH